MVRRASFVLAITLCGAVACGNDDHAGGPKIPGFGGSTAGGTGGAGGSSTGGSAGASGAATGGADTGGSGGATGGTGGTSTGGVGGSGGAGGSSGAGGTPTNGCCTPAATPGCTDSTVQSCVCGLDKFCCNTAWNEICVQEVDALSCGTCGAAGAGGGGGTGGSTGGAGGSGGSTAACTGTTAFECGDTGHYCAFSTCYACVAGTQNCNGIGGCECSGTCSGSQCSTCVDSGKEPNETPTAAASACPTVLCNINDCNGAGDSLSGVIKPGGDIDFFKFNGLDDLCVVDPTISTQTSGVEICVFPVCKNGDPSTTVKGCKQGTSATEGSYKGCCRNTPGTAQADIDCTGLNDSATVYIRVKGTNPNACTPYDVSYHY